MKKFSKSSKKFLSGTPHEYGSVAWVVSCEPKDDYHLICADLRITDCSNDISLDFCTREAEHLEKRIEKLDSLIESLQKFRKALTCDKLGKVVQQKLKKKESEE